MRTTTLTIILVALFLVIATGAWAEDWQWPSQVNVGGFQISDIRGSAKADGSGSAAGSLQIPGFGNTSVNLTRTSGGNITGNTSINLRGVNGSFSLSNSGLKGNGSVDCSPKSIENASISINSGGEATGNGRISLGRLNIPISFNMSSFSFSANGSAPVSAQEDTQIALYKFDGTLNLQGSNSGLTATASGRVERTGKLANQFTTINIPATTVDISSGDYTVNISGVSVTFKLF